MNICVIFVCNFRLDFRSLSNPLKSSLDKLNGGILCVCVCARDETMNFSIFWPF